MHLPIVQVAGKLPETLCLGNRRRTALQGKDQVLGVQLQLLQPHLFELFVLGEVGFPKQFFQPLSVAMMLGMQAINLFAQRRILVFVHQAPPSLTEHLHI